MVIDTDAGNEIDDQYALAYALAGADQLQVAAVYAAPFRREGLTVADSVDVAAAESERVLSHCAPALPQLPRVLAGSRRYLESTRRPPTSVAVDHLIATARDHDRAEPLTVLALGCATDVAAALLHAPDIAPRVEIVWDAAYPHHWPWRNRSYNLEQDLLAANVLLRSGARLVYIPGYYVAEQLALTREEADKHVRPAGEIGAYLWKLFPRCPHDRACSHVMWDIANVAYLIGPEWLQMRSIRAPRIDTDLRWRRRLTTCQIGEVVSVNRDAIFSDFFSRIRRAFTPP